MFKIFVFIFLNKMSHFYYIYMLRWLRKSITSSENQTRFIHYVSEMYSNDRYKVRDIKVKFCDPLHAMF